MSVVIIGAGMSGLTTAFLLRKRGFDVQVLEASSYAGGGAHSFEWNGHTCDWATHRLFTHDEHTLQQLLSLVPMNKLERKSRVYLGGKWLHDPVDVIQICSRFFPSKTLAIPLSYAFRTKNLPEESFRNYVYARFGRALSDFLLSPYTVKMFGIPAEDISVEWARKKVRVAGPLDVIRQGSKKKFNYFYYPRNGGYGAIPQSLYSELRDRVTLGAEVVGITTEGDRATAVRYRVDGVERELPADMVISTMPLTVLGSMLGHNSPLRYRSVAAVYALVNKPHVSPYHWIYYMDGNVVINRLCEFKNMNPNMGPPETSVVCAEVTDCEHPDLAERTVGDMVRSGLFGREEVLDTTVVSRDFSYPVYERNYEKLVDEAQRFLGRFRNVRWVGRAAQFEHLEVDDCFSAASHLVREIGDRSEKPPAVLSTQRPDLPVSPRLAAIVAARGNAEDTIECVKSIAASDYDQLTVALVCNVEDVDLRHTVEESLPSVTILTKPEDLGIPAAFNAGINWAMTQSADSVFLCLGHATVEPNTLSELMKVALRDPEAGILTPKILSSEHKDRIWSIGTRFRKFPPSIKTIGVGKPDDARFSESREVEFAVSSGLLVNAAVFEKCGLFDPGYQFYYEDVDFSRRARHDGFRIRFVPEARMFHKEASEPTRDRQFYYTWGESFARYYRRHMKPLIPRLIVDLGYLLLREALTGNAAHVPALLKGVAKGFHKRVGDIPRLDAEFV
ncbi:MAG: FAD-dependent oxidoreductase [Lentisphaerales bacterium]|jgi:protoporphyrinogen oxidase/GT2 family glycosyltransferase|nr:MAG: FAD-dependent oxidoreductase [Lentisphaerales bacterium]